MSAVEQARASLRRGDAADAERILRGAVASDPADAAAQQLLGLIRLRGGDLADARRHLEAAREGDPKSAEVHAHLTEVARQLGDLEAAIAAGRRAVELDPTLAPASNNLGLALQDVGDREAAEAAFRQAVAVAPTYPRGHYNLGNLLREAEEWETAEESLREALRLQPRYPRALNALGVVVGATGRASEAEQCFRRATDLAPRDHKVLLNYGNLLVNERRDEVAHRAYERALKLRPDYVEAWFARATLLQRQERYPEAFEALLRAKRVRPDDAEVPFRIGQVHFARYAYPEAIASFERALELDADHPGAACALVQARGEVGDWRDRDRELGVVRHAVAEARSAGEPAPIPPFVAFLPFTPVELLALARDAGDRLFREAAAGRRALGSVPRPAPSTRGGEPRIRIGYLSGDFRNHAVAHMSRSLYRLHDRDRFEVAAYSFGPDDGSDYRRGIATDCDRFVDLREMTDAAAAALIRGEGVDILVDLTGFTRGGRPGIPAYRPAPVQVSWMYPASTGGRLHDYILSDPAVTPPEHADRFGERLVLLPDCYHVTDYRQPIAETPVSRREQGLPDEGFVFCSFNKVAKIGPEIFHVWMRALDAVPGSVLWLLDGPGIENLRREARRRGVDPERLRPRTFAETKAEHLARHRLADLFLDTLVFNGHTTTADALWAGVPVLTRPGETFASRVASSMLHAVGLPELVVDDLRAYEELAIDLAHDADRLRALRAELATRRTTHPLFDTPRFVGCLERAYRAMWSRHAAGEPPGLISIDV